MTNKVCPNTSSPAAKAAEKETAALKPSKSFFTSVAKEILTVWTKSLLLNVNGFTVFGANGNLVFRVENYGSSHKLVDDILLMDAAGKPLLTIRKKNIVLMSFGEQWVIYKGEEATTPWLCVKKHGNVLRPKKLAHVGPCGATAGWCAGYEVEGSYSERSCAVYDHSRRALAEIRRKEAATPRLSGGGTTGLGFDVFSLLVYPGFDTSLAMAIVVLLEQMFG